jgi:hypothetical protein
VNAPAALKLAGGADDRACEANVGLDHRGHLVRRGTSVHLLEGLLAALLEGGLALGLVEGCRQDASAALASDAGLGTPCRRGRARHGVVIGTRLPIV